MFIHAENRLGKLSALFYRLHDKQHLLKNCLNHRELLMDFAYSPKVQELRERVTRSLDTYVYRPKPCSERQGCRRRSLAADGDHGRTQSQGQSEGLESVSADRCRPDQPRIRATGEIMEPSLLGGGRSTAPARTPTWRCWCVTQRNRNVGWNRCCAADPLGVRWPGRCCASSDATNMAALRAVRDGDEWVINGKNGGRPVLAIRAARF